MPNKENRSAMALTMGHGDSIILEGKDKTEVVFKEHYVGTRIRLVVIADKSVKISRKSAKEKGLR